MADDHKYFYAKFKLNHKLKIMDNMMLSESRSTVDGWKGTKVERTDKTVVDGAKITSSFELVMKDFERSINTFKTTVPFIMRYLPFMLRLNHDRSIRQYISKIGVRLDSDGNEFELYRIGIDHIASVERNFERSTAISSGIASIPELFLMGLISAYDQFLSNLIKCVFIARPEILSSSDKNISLKDIMEIGSVEAARERIIEKEVESIIRDSHSQQIEWLERKINIPLRKDLKIWPEFIEICERRNLISHTNGIVSSQYITVCNDHGVKLDDVTVGTRLRIDPKYYERAVSVILEFGIKLTQVLWRKLKPDELEIAETHLNQLAYKLITKRMYREANTLLRFGLYEMKKHGTELIKKMMVVNLANSEKLNGNMEQAEKILSEEDWSAATDVFAISVAAVRDDVEKVIKLMSSVVAAEHMRVSDFRDWPVFETVRSHPKFIETFEREFGQRILTDLESPTPSKLETELEEPGGETSNEVSAETIH